MRRWVLAGVVVGFWISTIGASGYLGWQARGRVPSPQAAPAPVAAVPEVPKPPSYEERVNAIRWHQFWYGDSGVFRERLSSPVEDGRYPVLWQEVIAKAQEAGFTFEVPQLRKTNAAFEAEIQQNKSSVLYAATYISANPRRVILNEPVMRLLPDSIARVILAHELGHAIDAQMQRMGHDVFIGLSSVDPMLADEIVADAVAERLYGLEAVREMRTINHAAIRDGQAIP